MIAIAEEGPGHHAAVAALHRAAFGGPDEADLVERLRRDDLVAASLVALEDGGVVIGHVRPLQRPAGRGGRRPGPGCVARAHGRAARPAGLRDRHAAGSRGAADPARAGAGTAVVVLGHVRYYPRFGFSAELARKLASPFPGEAFMALELVPGALAGRAGSVRYPAAFGIA